MLTVGDEVEGMMEHWHHNNECPDCGKVWSEHRSGYSAYRCNAVVPNPPDVTDLEKLLTEVTSGEWVVRKSPFEVFNVDHGPLYDEVSADYVLIAALYRSEANARLIAMAPALARKVISAEKLVEAVRQDLEAWPKHMTEGSALSRALAAWEAAQ